MTTATDIPEGLWIVFQNGGMFEGGMPGQSVTVRGQWSLQKGSLSLTTTTGDWGDTHWLVERSGNELVLTGPPDEEYQGITLTFTQRGD